MEQVHASCVAVDGTAVLLRGPSGSGKSDLALRLIDSGARLVADDRVDLLAEEGRVVASAPARIAGLIEVRGLGVYKIGSVGRAPLGLVVDLVPPDVVERLPEARFCEILGFSLPWRTLTAFESSAPAKIRLAMRSLAGIGQAIDPGASITPLAALDARRR
jgi:HPr kinase/phosphorylase